jgi:hypothetical protein
MASSRQIIQSVAAGAALPRAAHAARGEPLRLRYILASAMYGTMPLDLILPEVAKAGCESIDIWCRIHGNQREQITEMGDDAFKALLAKHRGVASPGPPMALLPAIALCVFEKHF